MGLLDNLKRATGIGLTPPERYDVAFEKGVLLGPEKFGTAADLFADAARAAAEVKDQALATRAAVNAKLYKYLATGETAALQALAESLPQVQQLERIGSQHEMMPAAPLLGEVQARLAEAALAEVPDNETDRKRQAHLQASQAFQRILQQPLITYAYRSADALNKSAQSRFFFHQGMANWVQGHKLLGASPDSAADEIAKALNAFRQAGDQTLSQEAASRRENWRRRRTCWVCHREFQGEGVHFRMYPANVYPYTQEVVQTLEQDTSSLAVDKGQIVLCSPCGSAVERIADSYARHHANQVRAELTPAIEALREAVQDLNRRVNHLEAHSHTH